MDSVVVARRKLSASSIMEGHSKSSPAANQCQREEGQRASTPLHASQRQGINNGAGALEKKREPHPATDVAPAPRPQLASLTLGHKH